MNLEGNNLPQNVAELQKIIGNLHQKLDQNNLEKTNLHKKYQQISDEKRSLEKKAQSLVKENKSLEKKTETLEKKTETLEKKTESLEKERKILLETTRLLRLKLFGRKSEKLNLPDLFSQLSLFEEIAEDYESQVEGKTPTETVVKSHKRKGGGRKPLPADLPREEVIHDIPEEDKICGCGCTLEKIGEETSEKLEIEQPRLYVKRHIRPKYACKNCEGLETKGGTVKIAPVPLQILPKSFATPSLLSHIITAKFVDSLPYYRQAKQFARHNITITRSTMSIWTLKLFERCYPLEKLLFKESRSGPLIQIDETSFQVLDEEGRGPSTKSYMWVIRGGPPGHPTVYFRYAPSRSSNIPKELLEDYKGIVQSDGYQGYNFLDKQDGITHMGCWAHVRRKFSEASKAGSGKKLGKADKALRLIAKLYKIEKDAREGELSHDDLGNLRQGKSTSVLEEIDDFLKSNLNKVAPKSLLGKAFKYTLSQWPRLIAFSKDGSIPIDNNRVENDIRPFVVGRKNWLFNQSSAGAHASAFFYSLVETAKANGIEPYKYLRYLFESIPHVTSEQDYKFLLPNLIDKELLK